MKKIILAIAMLTSMFSIEAQVTDTGSNVGIGTTSPQTKLHVNGETRTSDVQLNGGNIKVSIPTTTGGWARGLLYYNPGVYSTNEIGGIGMHGSALTPARIFLGFGDNPWNTIRGIQIKSNGFVGIGTTNPLSRFDITSGEYKTYFTGNSMLFKNNNVTSYIEKRDAGDLRFRMGVNYNTAMIIKSNLNIGIGTTSPSSRLHISSPSNESRTKPKDLIHLTATNSSVGYNGFGTSIVDFRRTYQNSTPHAINRISFIERGHSTSDQGGAITFSTKLLSSGNAAPVERMRVDYNGNIGIGTTSPTENLHVESDDNAVFKLRTNSHTANLGLLLQGKRDGSTNYSSHYIGADGDSHYNFKINADEGFKIQTNSVNRMFINGIGNVGIGTTTIPSEYKLAIAGKVISEEVKVQLQTNWPDYVFTSAYKLPSLEEVEQHIQEKGHLANIPSAKTVQNEGIFLGEMDAKLLEKIEELTLYTIQQEKDLKSQEERIEKQGQQIEELKTLVKQLLDSKK
ncbi:tail fiber protein [Tenacibaculum agarivorans]|uniref:tail fiber protein n=1 Tax=Tenacibaculum agarivorans TaxID=1908389 RepID=UPI00094B8B90|nr:tail fiber protein [Tenacibaculum agarivorans]